MWDGAVVTIALVIKVNDGVVLAADSATTLTSTRADGTVEIPNIYNNANKVFNLHKELPIGAMTWGLGNIGPASIATITKDLRARFHGEHGDVHWKLDPDAYDMNTIAERVHEFIAIDRYEPAFVDPGRIDLGFLTVGYSSGADQPSVYHMNLGDAGVSKPVEVLVGSSGAMWWGQPDAISRILNGFSFFMPQALTNLKIGLNQDQAVELTGRMAEQLHTPVVQDAMPIQDAIDLAEFLVHATIQFVKFSPGHQTVGGPIEIATITKHEGFKWVARKHFYDTRYNPPMEKR